MEANTGRFSLQVLKLHSTREHDPSTKTDPRSRPRGLSPATGQSQSREKGCFLNTLLE